MRHEDKEKKRALSKKTAFLMSQEVGVISGNSVTGPQRASLQCNLFTAVSKAQTSGVQF